MMSMIQMKRMLMNNEHEHKHEHDEKDAHNINDGNCGINESIENDENDK